MTPAFGKTLDDSGRYKKNTKLPSLTGVQNQEALGNPRDFSIVSSGSKEN